MNINLSNRTHTSISLEVFWCDHDNKSDDSLRSEHLVSPSPYRSDTLDSGDTIVGNQHLNDTGHLIFYCA